MDGMKPQYGFFENSYDTPLFEENEVAEIVNDTVNMVKAMYMKTVFVLQHFRLFRADALTHFVDAGIVSLYKRPLPNHGLPRLFKFAGKYRGWPVEVEFCHTPRGRGKNVISRACERSSSSSIYRFFS